MISSFSWVCSLDQSTQASHFCTCSVPEAFLCEQHIGPHIAKSTGIHDTFPVSAYGHHRTPGYRNRVTERGKALESGRRQAETNVDRIDACIKEVTEKGEELVSAVNEFVTKTVEDLLTYKEDLMEEIEKGAAEAEAHLYEDEVRLSTPLAKVFRSFQPGDLTLDWFSYKVSPKAYPEHLHDIACVEMRPIEDEISMLGHVTPREVSFFSVTSQSWSPCLPLSGPLTWVPNSRYLLLDATRLLCLGGCKSYPVQRTLYGRLYVSPQPVHFT